MYYRADSIYFRKSKISFFIVKWFVITSTLQQYFPALTGVRTISVWMIFVSHYHPPYLSKIPWILDLFQEMHVGVGVFFVLSGFLIGMRYAEVFSRKFQVADLYIFYLNG